MTYIIDSKQLKLGNTLTYNLNINSQSTVHALSLLRLAVFTPIAKRNSKNRPVHNRDVSSELRNLEFSRKEGFENVMITGLALSFETDFKVWCGVVRAFSEYGYSSSEIQFKFTEFAKLCGFPSKRIDGALRTRIHDSLVRLRGQTLSFYKPQKEKAYIGGLLHSAYYDATKDKIALTADPKLWELYQLDHLVMLKMNVLQKLSRVEVCQCLYAYLSSLPRDPAPISYMRLRERLALTGTKKEQNRTITNAIKKLEEIGYLSGSIVTLKGERHLLIVERCHKLSLFSDLT